MGSVYFKIKETLDIQISSYPSFNMFSEKKIKKILQKYHDLKYRGSYQGVQVFRKALAEVDGIHVSSRALRRILTDDVLYATFMSKKHFLQSHVVSKGVGIAALSDTVFMKYGKDNEKELRFLIVQDVASRFIYTQLIPGSINKESMRKAFLKLWRNKKMHNWSILRCDLDPTILANRDIFEKRNCLLLEKRGGKYLHILERTIQTLEHKLSPFLLSKPSSNLEKCLRNVTQSFNSTPHASHSYAPRDVNSPIFDAMIRSRDRSPLRPFSEFLHRQLRLQKKVHEGPLNENKLGEWSKYKVGDRVLLNFPKTYLKRGYNYSRGPIYRIGQVLTQYKPFIFRLQHLNSNEFLKGYYNHYELGKFNKF